MKVAGLIILLVAGWAGSALAQTKPYQATNITICFYGRPIGEAASAFGHAFITINYDQNGQAKEESYGFYPFSVGRGGWVYNDFEKINRAQLLRISTLYLKRSISIQELKGIYKLMSIFDSGEYSLTNHNCVKFVHSIAQSLKMNVPPSADWIFPHTYLNGLKALNP